jgi:hypothetical protein
MPSIESLGQDMTPDERNERMNQLIDKRKQLLEHYNTACAHTGEQALFDLDEIHPEDIAKLQAILMNPQQIPVEAQQDLAQIKALEEEILKLAA